MVFALFTLSNLFIYDTGCAEPVAMVTNLHLATITDVVWTPDGCGLMVRSVPPLGAIWAMLLNAFGITAITSPQKPKLAK